MISINVWYYNEILSEWILKGTSDYLETKDEYKYFRVLSNGRKYFYASAEDYIKHNKNLTYPLNYNIGDNSMEYSNINGNIVYVQ